MVLFRANDKSEVVSSQPSVVLKRRLNNSKAVLEAGSVSVLSKEGGDLGMGVGSAPWRAPRGPVRLEVSAPGNSGDIQYLGGGDCERSRS